jgi:hypothetical protein
MVRNFQEVTMSRRILYCVLLVVALAGAGCDMPNDGKVRGSCNDILFSCVCEDYIGSYWTEENMKLQCSSNTAFFSLDACNYTTLGGCKNASGMPVENIVWVYDEGCDDPFDQETAGYTRESCLAVGGQWVYPADMQDNGTE